MKTKHYRYGKYSCKTYYKPIGAGYETAFVFDGTPVFVGNFIHPEEATRWYAIMNREIAKFAKKYTTGHKFPAPWFRHFISNHLYRWYYAYLDKLFAKYNRSYSRAYFKDVAKYRKYKSHYSTPERKPYLRVA